MGLRRARIRHHLQNLSALRARAASPARDQRDRVSQRTGGSETILLVEDEAAVRRATAEFLRLQGYNVIEALDGVDVLALAQEQGNDSPGGQRRCYASHERRRS